MKRKLFLCATLLLGLSSALCAQNGNGNDKSAKPATQAAQKITWTTNYQQAVSQAQQGNKHIFLFFTGSDWCGWCKKFENEALSTPQFAQGVGERFVFVEVDFPMSKALPADLQKQNADLKKKYGVTGYPTVVILDSAQNFVAETGYRPGGGKAYADYLLQFIK